MRERPKRLEFKLATRRAALNRQDGRCAACAMWIHQLPGKEEGQELGWTIFTSWVRSHHLRPAAAGGDASIANCVIICKDCHYSVHGGGAYVNADQDWQTGKPSDYICYDGTKPTNPEGLKMAKEMDKKYNMGPFK